MNAITDHDKPTYGASPNSQKATTALFGLKPICNRWFDSPRRWRWYQTTSLLHKSRPKVCGDPLPQSQNGVLGNSLCITKIVPLFLGL